jgi:hypothetical protein
VLPLWFSWPLSCVQGVLQAHPLSAAAQTVVEGALGDMHGSLTESAYPENANTLNQNSVSIGGMSLSIHGLSTRRSRCATAGGFTVWDCQNLVRGPRPGAGEGKSRQTSDQR